jgi:molybdopterin-guanine dinucleotide biosynthesis protein A
LPRRRKLLAAANNNMTKMISGVILAGGANRRFGGITKASLKIDDEKIISRIINTISGLFGEIIIVTNTPEEFRDFIDCRIIGDQYKNAGPLGGIHAALKYASSDAIFVFAGDMPFLDRKIIEKQIEEFNISQADILMPKVGELIEPLHSIYRKTVLEDLGRFLSEGLKRAVRDFIPKKNTDYFYVKETEANLKAFTNINLPSDLLKY